MTSTRSPWLEGSRGSKKLLSGGESAASSSGPHGCATAGSSLPADTGASQRGSALGSALGSTPTTVGELTFGQHAVSGCDDGSAARQPLPQEHGAELPLPTTIYRASRAAGASATADVRAARTSSVADSSATCVSGLPVVTSDTSTGDLGLRLATALVTRGSSVEAPLPGPVVSAALAAVLADGRSGDSGSQLSQPAGGMGSVGGSSRGFSRAEESVEAAATRLLRFVFKIADFGLAVQGTPFYAAPEVVLRGHFSPAADLYSFGVLLWLLLHGTVLGTLRPLLPRVPFAPIAPVLLSNASPRLPPSALALLRRCLDLEPSRRGSAAELRAAVEELLREVAGPELGELLLSSERAEVDNTAAASGAR
ncbi:hypothetical protein GPECTOR_9g706 [Gonium pectorale]|uniref:Protein kinase domain-containing protein n=1 Tax=Gonium pectorale TaxID=33097 RepID=A0A150GS77_GONPE|nr:hypothetical protein GPECTOR_9g706 [Gonium pectorale]|eukprot:KXZ52661.1 hypothetical protein GPECTOR_9g706 [Gonium pectorale]